MDGGLITEIKMDMSTQAHGATLITGSSGFIGLALCEALLARGETVIGCDISSPPMAAKNLFDTLPGSFTHVAADVRDAATLQRAMSDNRVDRIVALAAITADIERERRAAGAVIEVNVGGCIATLEAARAAGVKRIVFMSSGSAYGGAAYRGAPLLEDETPTKPESLYGISKLAAEQTALRLGAVFNLDVVAGRLGTCFGPWEYVTGARDTPSAVLQIVTRMKAGNEVILPRPHPRDWLYSRDAASAIIALMDAPSFEHQVYNLGAGFEWSLTDLCMFLGRVDKSFKWKMSEVGEGNINLYGNLDRDVMDTARIEKAGFVPRYDLELALSDYLAWWDKQ